MKLTYIVGMHVTLDQARALQAFSHGGTLAAAARTLGRTHSAVLYSLKQLEAQTGLKLLDRSGYRIQLTAWGDEVLKGCGEMLDAERRLIHKCAVLRDGWEPVLTLVFDAIYPLGSALEVVRLIRGSGAPTHVHLKAESLAGVEQRFVNENAALMVTVLPVNSPSLTVVALPRFEARLVAHYKHPLAGGRQLSHSDLDAHVLLTVRAADPRLQLPGHLDEFSAVNLSDFHAKKAAILAGIGFGWLPDWLTFRELQRGELVTLDLREGASHTFVPLLAFREPLGLAGRLAVEHLAPGWRGASTNGH